MFTLACTVCRCFINKWGESLCLRSSAVSYFVGVTLVKTEQFQYGVLYAQIKVEQNLRSNTRKRLMNTAGCFFNIICS